MAVRSQVSPRSQCHAAYLAWSRSLNLPIKVNHWFMGAKLIPEQISYIYSPRGQPFPYFLHIRQKWLTLLIFTPNICNFELLNSDVISPCWILVEKRNHINLFMPQERLCDLLHSGICVSGKRSEQFKTGTMWREVHNSVLSKHENVNLVPLFWVSTL